jgi:hypothetical protein
MTSNPFSFLASQEGPSPLPGSFAKNTHRVFFLRSALSFSAKVLMNPDGIVGIFYLAASLKNACILEVTMANKKIPEGFIKTLKLPLQGSPTIHQPAERR